MEIIGEAYRELQILVKKYAKADLPVLFYGETGTGKELFMQLFIDSSRELKKRTGEYRIINCAAISEKLLYSEVFGHVKGAFSDAVIDRDGYLKTCADGILALDEIGDATPQFQAAILRVVENHSYLPVGSDEVQKTNTLIIAATNKPKALRPDLIERFHLLPIPSLQKEDIPVLARHFFEAPIREDVIRDLQSKKYKGNIRQFKWACERLKLEKDDNIFETKKDSKRHSDETYQFDYNRYRREMNTWDRYIQPLIDYYGNKHGFGKYRYQYMPWDEDSLDWILSVDDGLNPKADNKSSKKCLYVKEYFYVTECWEMYDIVKYLKICIGDWDDFPRIDKGPRGFDGYTKGEEKCIKAFKEKIRAFFEKSILPCLLGYIYLRAERQPEVPTALVAQPHLSYLLDLKWNDAKKELFKHYYAYNVKKYANTDELETAVGMTKKSLNQKYQQHKHSQPSDSSLK